MRAHLDSPNVHFLQKRKKIKKKQIKKDYELTKCQVIKEKENDKETPQPVTSFNSN